MTGEYDTPNDHEPDYPEQGDQVEETIIYTDGGKPYDSTNPPPELPEVDESNDTSDRREYRTPGTEIAVIHRQPDDTNRVQVIKATPMEPSGDTDNDSGPSASGKGVFIAAAGAAVAAWLFFSPNTDGAQDTPVAPNHSTVAPAGTTAPLGPAPSQAATAPPPDTVTLPKQ